MDWKLFFFFIAGFFLLIKGADLLVDGAAALARRFRISDIVIGLTIVPFSTSTPELVVNLMASFHGNSELAVGNILGSNIANILLILGIASVIRPIPFLAKSNADILMTIFASLLLFLFIFIGRRHTLQRSQGVLFLFIYAGYIGFLVRRG